MKKYIVICSVIVFLLGVLYYVNFYTSLYLNFNKDVSTFVKTDNKDVLINNNKFNIKGINLASTIPTLDDHDYKIEKDTYLKWFHQIQDMNVNTIRVYSIESPTFYKAFYEYNRNNDNPLYLIQGMDVGDYEENSSVDYFDSSLKNKLTTDVKTMVDVIHGRRVVAYNTNYASGKYSYDVSKWTIGYIVGTEWNDVTVEYTNKKYPDMTNYEGDYLKTSKDATPFERILCEIGDQLLSYESLKYNTQKLLSFGNYPQTDPFDYDEAISDLFNKFAKFDMAHIVATPKVESGLFAAFQAYSGYPDYYSLMDKEYSDSYKEYLTKLNDHYEIPVVISEFGYSTSRGETIDYLNDNYGSGNLNEKKQGELIEKSIDTIMSSGISGFIIYEWQDEWDNGVWNTMYSKDMTTSQYWYDVQTSTSSFGVLSFVPDSSVNIDGDISEWKKSDVVTKNKDLTISSKYDASYVYFLIQKENLDFDDDTIYIPIDTTNKSGAKSFSDYDISFDRGADFIIKINGKNNSKILVQEYYDTLMAIFGKKINGKEPFEKDNIPSKNSTKFSDIKMITSTQNLIRNGKEYEVLNKATTVNTNKLVYGNSNYNSKNYNSLGDIYTKGNNIEIRIPWGLLNFYDPSLMKIHDDYYKNYGVDGTIISKMYIGVGETKNIKLAPFTLEAWGKNIAYKERLKKSYFVLQNALKEEG